MVDRLPMTSNTSDQDKLRDWGFKDAGDNKGDASSLKGCLGKVENYLIEGLESKKVQYQATIDDLKKQNASLSSESDALTKIIRAGKSQIADLKAQLKELIENPKIADAQSEFNALGFNIGATLLVFLTLYLLLFYSSATYSALFKNFGAELAQASDSAAEVKTIFKSIFDPGAFREAWKEGAYGLIFICLAPILFVATGFTMYSVPKLVHKIAVLLLVFIADFAIAYKIDSSIYEAKYLTGLVNEVWKASMAFQDVNFYLVLIAGFAAYLVWGLLLDYVAKQYELSRPFFGLKKKLEAQIQKYEEEVKETEDKLNFVKSRISANETEIENLGKRLHTKVISSVEMSTTVDAYFSGWTAWCNSSETSNKVAALEKIEQAAAVLAQFKNEFPLRYSPSDEIKEVLDK